MTPRLSPLRQIRLMCLDCCGGIRSDVAACTALDCPLYAFRMGKRPKAEPAPAPKGRRAARQLELKIKA